jgi:hypothetical protein
VGCRDYENSFRDDLEEPCVSVTTWLQRRVQSYKDLTLGQPGCSTRVTESQDWWCLGSLR